MYLPLILALLGGAIAGPLAIDQAVPRDDNRNALFVLPGESYPTFYDVRLFLDPGNAANFTGEVSIRILANNETNTLVLHAMELEISSIEIYEDGDDTTPANNLFSTYSLARDDTHLLRIQLNRNISALVPHVIHISYVGHYAENMFGIYLSTYENQGQRVNLITTQLQPTFARRAFPCYDEPALKAIFRTTIYAPPGYPVVRSNMPERNDELKQNVAGYLKYEFEDTLVMSTYLLAYLVSNFNHVSNDDNPIYSKPFRIYSRPGTQENALYALDFGQRNMLALEEYTEMPYAFPKMDKAAVPDFAAGAMENWGLVIYREVALLVQEGVTTTNIRQNIARIVCHENVHMWFGNEVGPQSWTYTWLNEGFANFFENFATDFVLPNYRMMDQFVLLLQGVMQNDAVLNVNPMTHPVYTPSEILSTFNAVAYQKSGSVIRMTQHFLTPEVFRRGLVVYLRNNARGAAHPTNLYAALQESLDQSNHSIPYPLSTVLDRWTNQGGFPVLTVRRSAPTAESVIIAQERFLTDSKLSSPERWHVPVNWVLSTNVDFTNTSPQAWVPPSFPALSIDIPGLSQAEWFIVNKQQTGYYRVNYDPENWEALARVLQSSHETIHVLNRAQIVDDAFNLARNGRLVQENDGGLCTAVNVFQFSDDVDQEYLATHYLHRSYEYAFDISRYLVLEEDYIPWASANTALNYVDLVLSGSSVYPLFQAYMLELTAPTFERLGFTASLTEEHVTAYHRNIVLDINCRYGKQECVDQAQTLLEQFRNNPDQRINPDIQTTVFCSGLRGGDVDNFNFLWQQYQGSSDPSQQSILLNALGCTSNATLRQNYLNQVIDDNSPVREQDKHSIIVAVINSSPENMEAALDFVVEHFPDIQTRVQGLTGTMNILNTFARRLNSAEHNSKIDRFVSLHQSIFTAGELASIAAIRENIAASITWTNENLGTVDSWLRQNYGNGANSLASSLVVIVSLFVAVFNL